MKLLKSKIMRLITDEEAATAVEYAVMLMLIVGVCITAIQLVGGEAGAVWDSNGEEIGDAIQTARNTE